MKQYNHKTIEKKWQAAWAKQKLYATPASFPRGKKKPQKKYVLDMFPYPSGDGLHVGHPKGYIATDVYARMARMVGHTVLHPMGWDAFGLPAENYALAHKLHPAIAVKKNIARFKKQLAHIGFDYDWSREINTTDPNYYRWTQWIFLQMFHHGLAYESYEPINWCPSCKTGLANEDVEEGKCERCGTIVEKRPLRQWVLKITQYADRLLAGLKTLDWPLHIKKSQEDWIGRSEGAEIEFHIADEVHGVTVFTTRPDTLFGATYLVLAPEHAAIENWKLKIGNWDEVQNYLETIKTKTEIERTAEGKEKTGVELKGVKALNPATEKEIPIWIADYVLAQYGTGAIMAVPAHDERDYQFAQKYNLPVISVIEPVTGEILPTSEVYLGEGVVSRSGEFSGQSTENARRAMAERYGKIKVEYKLRDWVFSRQRYWGEPIPLIHCEKCGVVPVPEKDLPVTLPKVKSYEPTGTGESPLATISKWVNVTCPTCGGKGKRETNTMPQWAGSSWYYLAYVCKKAEGYKLPAKSLSDWLPVDMYVGGAEHATRHLIYARFWHAFLYDIGVVAYEEPFRELKNVGLVLAEDGRKMSKRWGNVINPDDIVERYGADTLRLYELFMGPFENAIAWNTESMIGCRRFLERVWRLQGRLGSPTSNALEMLFHQTIKKVTEDIEHFKFNTAISALMILVNAIEKEPELSLAHYRLLLQLLAPFAPHMTDEVWHVHGGKESVHTSSWPNYDPKKLAAATYRVVVQVNGKPRDMLELVGDIDEAELVLRARAREKVAHWIYDKPITRVIYVPRRVLNLVV